MCKKPDYWLFPKEISRFLTNDSGLDAESDVIGASLIPSTRSGRIHLRNLIPGGVNLGARPERTV